MLALTRSKPVPASSLGVICLVKRLEDALAGRPRDPRTGVHHLEQMTFAPVRGHSQSSPQAVSLTALSSRLIGAFDAVYWRRRVPAKGRRRENPSASSDLMLAQRCTHRSALRQRNRFCSKSSVMVPDSFGNRITIPGAMETMSQM